MKVPNPATGCEEYDAYTVIAGLWMIYEDQLMQEARFEEMPTTKEEDNGTERTE